MNHTFFLESTWELYGTFYDIDYQPFIMEGTYTSEYQNNQLIVIAQMLMHSTPTTEFNITYYINPTANGAITWQSTNSILGKFNGKMVIIEDTMLVTYESIDLINSGIESYQKISDTHYLGKGTFLKGSQRISSWSVHFNQFMSSSNKSVAKSTITL